MKKYIHILFDDIRHKPLAHLTGMGVLLVSVMGTSVQHVASTVYALLLLASFMIMSKWRDLWRGLSPQEKLLMAGFAAYALSGVFAYVNVQDVDEYVKDLERYLRFMAAIPVYLYLKYQKTNLMSYLVAGAVISGPFLAWIAYMSYLDEPDLPSRGDYHHIIFGGLAMLNVGIMMVFLLKQRLQFAARMMILVSIVLGCFAVVMSQSRAVWLVVPVYLVMMLVFSWRRSVLLPALILAVVVLFAGAVAVSPTGDIIEKRVDAAVKEVVEYYEQDKYATSVGARLAMWEIAIDVWKEHPLIGTGPGDFDEVIRTLQEEGRYVGMEVHGSTHNIYIQALVNTGLYGLLSMMFAIMIWPVVIFFKARNVAPEYAETGMVTIVLFAILGISESWTLRLPIVSTYIVYLVVIVSAIQLSLHEDD